MKIRTVFQPGEEIDVPDDDAEVLRLNGLLHTPAPEAPAPPAPAKAPEPKTAAAAPTPRPPSAPAASTDQAPSIEKG